MQDYLHDKLNQDVHKILIKTSLRFISKK